MSVINESVKQFLAEVDKFFSETIKNEKISKKAQEHKQLIVEKLTKLFEENPYLRVSTQDAGKGKDNLDDSLLTGGSTKSDGSEEAAYCANGILMTSASELQNTMFSGNLEKKQKKGSGLFGSAKFQTRWCVIHGGNFYYYVRQEDKKQAGCFRLEGYQFKNSPDITKQKKDKELAFELFPEEKSKRVYQFVAPSKDAYEKVKTAVLCGGFLEGDGLYEPIGGEAPIADEMYVEDVGIGDGAGETQELYSDPDSEPQQPEPVAQSPPPPPPPPTVSRAPSSKSGTSLPPLPATPVPTVSQKQANPPEPEPPLIEDEIYEEAFSEPQEKSADDPPPPPPPPTRGLPPHPPAAEPPSRRLPPTPVEAPQKKKIKLNITCKPDEDFENKYFGKWDCKGDNTSELTFRRGDIIYVLSKELDDKSWWIGELNGKFGLVPKTYLTPAYTLVA